MIAIRVDANNKIGSGHLMRCMAVARRLKKIGEKVLFIVADDTKKDLILKEGFEFLSLNSEYDLLDKETDKVISAIKMYNIKIILIDSYFVTQNYFFNIRKYAKIAYFDDTNNFIYNHVDFIINYNFNYEEYKYFEKYYNKDTKLLLGPVYAPLREEFENMPPKNIKRNVEDILITTGGTDNYNLCGEISKKLLLKTDAIIHIAVGPFFKYKNILQDIAKNNKNIILHENANMNNLMQKCDIAVSTSGSTVYELCACGMPSVLLTIAENQFGICNFMSKHKYALYSGNYNENIVLNVIDNVMLLINNKQIRDEISFLVSKLVDGNGAERIASILITSKKAV